MVLKYLQTLQDTFLKYFIIFFNFQIHTSLPLPGVLSGVAASEAAVDVALAAALGLVVTGTIFSHSEILPNTFKNCGWFTQVLNHLVTFTSDFLSAGSNALKKEKYLLKQFIQK